MEYLGDLSRRWTSLVGVLGAVAVLATVVGFAQTNLEWLGLPWWVWPLAAAALADVFLHVAQYQAWRDARLKAEAASESSRAWKPVLTAQDRSRLSALKRDAGSVLGMFIDPGRNLGSSDDIDRIKKAAGQLRHCPGIAKGTRRLTEAMEALLHRDTPDTQFEATVAAAEGAYERLVRRCDELEQAN